MLVYQVPIPEPLRFLEPRETETRTMHALEEYGLMHVKLYEDIAAPRPHRHHLCLSGEGRGPLRDGPLAHPQIRQSENGSTAPALQLFGAGREKRIYAVPPYTNRRPAGFRGPSRSSRPQFRPGLRTLRRRPTSYLDEVVHRRRGRSHVRLLGHRPLRGAAQPPAIADELLGAAPSAGAGAAAMMTNSRLLSAEAVVEVATAAVLACRDIGFELHRRRSPCHRR